MWDVHEIDEITIPEVMLIFELYCVTYKTESAFSILKVLLRDLLATTGYKLDVYIENNMIIYVCT